MAYKIKIAGPDRPINPTALGQQVSLAVPCRLFSAIVSNNGPDQWIQIHDVVGGPLTGDVPLFFQFLAAGSTFYFDLGTGLPFINGMVICNSLTAATWTEAAQDCLFQASIRLGV